MQDVDFTVTGNAAEDRAACLFDPSFNLKQLPPDPRPEIDRDVLVQVGLKRVIHGWEYICAVSSVGLKNWLRSIYGRNVLDRTVCIQQFFRKAGFGPPV